MTNVTHKNHYMMHGQQNVKFLGRFSKYSRMSNFIKIRSLVVPCRRTQTDGRPAGRTDRHTDTTELIVAVCNFVKAIIIVYSEVHRKAYIRVYKPGGIHSGSVGLKVKWLAF